MKKTTALLLLLTTALLQPLALQAKPGKGDVEGRKGQFHEKARERMKQIDSDGDGSISYVEAESAEATRLLENFDAIDSNGDGTLTRQELGAHHKKRIAEKMKDRKQES